jgi:alanyl-tRNA synthetase
MSLTHRELRKKIRSFWDTRDHQEVPPISLVPQNDPTTLFTGSGMQQFVPNLLGEPHPQGTKLYNIQNCIRVQDIEEVGDNRHDTFFEMIGNWSLGDYFKKEQLEYFFTFLTDKKTGLGLDPDRLYVTAFEGNDEIVRDDISIEAWKQIFKKAGMNAEVGERIFLYDAKKNWWSRAGVPSNMPAGEPGGPDSEVFYRFDAEHDPAFGKECHPNCDCGRFLEIGNSVFMEYKKLDDGSFQELPKKNVDFGGGLERLLAASQNDPDVFKTDVFIHIIQSLEKVLNRSYDDKSIQPAMRIIADHLKTSTFIIRDGVTPSNKEQGYVLRRLLRRAMVKMRSLNDNSFSMKEISPIIKSVLDTYDGIYFEKKTDEKRILPVIEEEVNKFQKTLIKGLKEIEKMNEVDAKAAFDLYQTYGFPLEITEEILKEKGLSVNRDDFYAEFDKHKNLSRTSSAGKFKGGLADHSEQVVRYHTATHLLHQALFDVLGDSIRQEGSNITGERLRFDFYADKKPTDDDIKKVETIINEKIKEALPMEFAILPKAEAEQIGAKSFFKEKYGDQVKVYFIGADKDHIKDAYSKEFCGGPHVTNTKDIGKIAIERFKKIGSNLYRIYAQ